MSILRFYENYIELLGALNGKSDRAYVYKENYLKKIIKDGKVYKYISLEGAKDSVRDIVDTLKQKKIWFSFYKALNDNTEFQINYNAEKISEKTGRSVENIKQLVNYLTEMYDVYSLTYEYQDYMWEDYASDGNGICVEFNVTNYDYLYPVEYMEKVNIDFDKMIISAINGEICALSIIPWVVKNPYNYSVNIASEREKEVRILYCPYDLGEVNGGRIEMNIKERLGYKGIAKPCTDFGLEFSKVIFGSKCSAELRCELERCFGAQGIMCEYL